MPTPHINLEDKKLVAKTVLMPGDPLRAKWIAETFLTDVVEINHVRNMLGYTGKYKNKLVTVMGSGMGMPSIGIYSYELYKFYDVENIIRIGTAGSYSADLKCYDVVLASHAYSKSSYAKTMGVTSSSTLKASTSLNNRIIKKAGDQKLVVCGVHSSDNFYYSTKSKFDYNELVKKNILCVEMESFALFANAKELGKKATCLLTISDNIVTGDKTSPLERQTKFSSMVVLALEAAK